jgi:hypothetical protein
VSIIISLGVLTSGSGQIPHDGLNHPESFDHQMKRASRLQPQQWIIMASLPFAQMSLLKPRRGNYRERSKEQRQAAPETLAA